MAEGGSPPITTDPKRHLSGGFKVIALVLGISASLFNLIAYNIYPLDPLIVRAVFLFATSAIAFLVWPFSRKHRSTVQALDLVFILLSAAVAIYTVIEYENIIARAGVLPTRMDVAFGVVLILVVLEMARRTMGPVLPILAMVVLFYGIFGQVFPGMFEHTGIPLDRLISFIYSTDGIYGVPLAVTVTYVFVFVLFGAFMEAAGSARVLMDLATSVAGRSRGGTAKVAVVGSSFFGSINGSPVANVMATGTFTIPLMKKSGYSPAFAGGVEAAASTGGQILPPVMGASIFIMIEILGIPYSSVVVAATIPALLYYVGVFWMVDLEARKEGLKGLPASSVPRVRDVLRGGGYLLIPVVVLVYTLVVMQVSPLRAGLWGIISCMVVSYFKRESRLGIGKIAGALYQGSANTAVVMAAVALAGVIVGIFGLTGLGLNMVSIIVGYSGGFLPLALLLAMTVTIILGVGMPTTASYIIGATVIAPALVNMGIIPIAAHLFVLYFANMSNITPPWLWRDTRRLGWLKRIHLPLGCRGSSWGRQVCWCRTLLYMVRSF